jgi:TetR/AcrR family transcriptional regulator, copper-responsive repressor
MVQKSSSRRGRPRAYDPETALSEARRVFWDAGYAATSMDDLTAGTGMNKPSLYGAFGDKRAIYQRTLEDYQAFSRAALADALPSDQPLRVALRRLYETALSLYRSGPNGPRGCYLIGTALTESVRDPAARAALAETLLEIDAALEARIRHATDHGELPASAKPGDLAKVGSAILHSLAVRARAGHPEADLRALIEAGVDAICGSGR